MYTHARRIGLVSVTLALFLALCRAREDFARLAWERLSRPALLGLHRLTAGVPFPVAEPLALLLAAALLFSLLGAARSALRRKDARALGRWLLRASSAALALCWAFALLWAPACGLPSEAPPPPDAGQLEWLCGQLIDALDELPDFPEVDEVLRLAPRVAGLPGCAVKAARYPEWMRAAGISGLFVPVTGEALADCGAPLPLVPFTAVHELAHLCGIAGEGEANIAAWRLCMAHGGAFADSARLWALRYAMGLLAREDPAAWRRAREKMEDPLARIFRQVNGEAAPTGRTLLGADGSYAALVGYLIS